MITSYETSTMGYLSSAFGDALARPLHQRVLEAVGALSCCTTSPEYLASSRPAAASVGSGGRQWIRLTA
ncbi:hypothetical protein [Streptomyces sp. NPDC052015]|uniref:hypothetical protein n=1 Tax=Streptomyces sp. NPDC052015 TaxID=3154755 RepID=UPI00341AF37A